MQGGSRTNTVLFVGFMCFVIVWRVWETFHKQGEVRGRTRMVWSFYVLFALSCVIFLGTILEFFFVDRPHSLVWSLVGIALFIVANAIRLVAIRTLGRFWSLHIEIREEHSFVRQGIYRVVRHPAYLAFVIEAVAVPLVGAAWWSLAVAVCLYVPMIVWRIAEEDRALVEKFGDAYRDYQREVGALVPRF